MAVVCPNHMRIPFLGTDPKHHSQKPRKEASVSVPASTGSSPRWAILPPAHLTGHRIFMVGAIWLVLLLSVTGQCLHPLVAQNLVPV